MKITKEVKILLNEVRQELKFANLKMSEITEHKPAFNVNVILPPGLDIGIKKTPLFQTSYTVTVENMKVEGQKQTYIVSHLFVMDCENIVQLILSDFKTLNSRK